MNPLTRKDGPWWLQILTRLISGGNNSIILYEAIFLAEHIRGDDDSRPGVKLGGVHSHRRRENCFGKPERKRY